MTDSNPSGTDPFGAIADEFVEAFRQGKHPSVEDFARRYPAHAAEIREMLPALVLMEKAKSAGPDHPSPEEAAFLTPPQEADEVGRLGRYRVLAVLGRGGMGVVFKAEDSQLGRAVALKVMLPALAATPSARERFFREARAAAALKHPHVVTIYQVGEDRGAPFLAMELLEGESLDARLEREGRLPVPDVLRIGREIAQGLAAAHAKGVIHRDVKPGNLWLEAPHGHVKVLDFGLARALSASAQLTQSGAIVGTPAYMAPEQAGSDPVDHRCDLFGLGCILYQMCTGQLAFQGEDVYATLMAVATREPPPPAELRPDLPEGLNRLILTLLSKDPAGRPASADLVAENLRAIERGDVPAIAPAEHRRPSSRRRRFGLVALAVGGLAALAVGILLHRHGQEPPPKTGEIETEPFRWEAGAPLSDAALVQRPGAVPGLAAWTLLPRGPEGGIHGVAYRPDGQQLAVADAQGIVRIWDANTGQLVRVLGHPLYPAGSGIAWSPDGRYLATGPDRTVRVWDAAAGRLLRTLPGHSAEVRSLAWSPDGRTLASTAGGGDRTIRLWDPLRGEERGFLDGHEGPVGEVSWSPDGKTLASASDDATVRLWSVESGTCLHVLRKAGKVRGLAWSPTGKEFATGGEDRTVQVWDATSGTVLRVFRGHTGTVNSVVWLPDGQALASAGLDGAIRVWKRTPGEPRAIPTHGGAIGRLAVSPDGGKLLCGREDGSLQEWDLTSGVERQHIPAGTPPMPGWVRLTWSPDGGRFACHGEDGTVSVWQADSARKLLTLPGATPCFSVAWSADGRRLAVAAGSPLVPVWDAASGQLVQKLVGHAAGVLFVAWSPDGKVLASASKDRTVRLWDGVSGQPLRTLEGHTGAVTALAWSADGKRLASGGVDGMVRLWQADADRAMQVIPTKAGELSAVAWSPDGKVVASGGADRAVRLWDAGSGKEIGELLGHRYPVRWLSWSAGGLLASTGSDGEVWVWEGKTGQFLFNPEGDAWARPGANWSPDGKTLAAGGALGALHFWDARGRRRATLRTLPGGPSLAVAPEGHFLASPGGLHRWMVVALTDSGEYQTFAPEEFAARFGRHNDPSSVQPLGRPAGRPPEAPDPYEIKPGEGFGPQALVRRSPALPGVRAWTVETRGARTAVGGQAVAYSPDGAWLATGHADGSLRLWEAGSGRPLRILLGHTAGVTALAWSADGKTLVSGSDDRTVRTWDARAGRLLRTLRGHGSAPAVVALAPDGRTLGSAGTGSDDAVRLWDVESGDPLSPLSGARAPVLSLAWSPGGRRVAGAGADGVLHLWDPETGQLHAGLQGHAGPVRGVAWSPDGKTLVSGGEDRTLRFWDLASGKQVRLVEGLPGPVTGVAWSPDGLRIASGSGPRGEVQVRDAAGTLQETLAGRPGPVRGLAWAPDGKSLVGRGEDGVLRHWEVGRPEPVRAVGPPLTLLRVPSPDGLRLTRRAEGGGLHLEPSPVVFPAWQPRFAYWGRPLAYSPDGKRIATAWGGEEPRVWDADSGKILVRLGEDVGPEAVVWSPDGTALATTGSAKGLRVWDPQTGALRHTLREGADPGSLAWSPDGKVIVTVEGGQKARLFDAGTGKQTSEIALPVKGAGRSTAWSPDGKIMAGGSDKEAVEWNKTAGGFILAESPTEPHGGYLPGVYCGLGALAWAPDSKRLLGGLDDGTVRLWDVPAEEQNADAVGEWHGHAGPVRGVAWAGRQVISNGDDGTLRVWEADTGKPVFTLLSPAGKQEVAISAEGHYRGGAGIEAELIFVVLTDRGEQENLAPGEFASRYGWTNDPDRVGPAPKGGSPP